MRSTTTVSLFALTFAAFVSDSANANPSRSRRGQAVRQAFAHVDARGLDHCRVGAVVDERSGVRVTLTCEPRSVVVVVRDGRVVADEVIVLRPRPRPAPTPRETVVIVDDHDSDSDSDSDRGKRGHRGRHHDDDSDSDSDSR